MLPAVKRDARFIPAPAGNRPGSPPSCCSVSVHPRACGEQQTPPPPARLTPVHPRACGEQGRFLLSSHRPSGSSPRLRGTGPAPRREVLRLRFIPAPAGNRAVCQSTAAWVTVHPRACGEQVLFSVSCGLSYGSSPRLRGTVFPLVCYLGRRAVHPRACGEQAGERLCDCGSCGSSRACGEQFEPLFTHPFVIGSSPRLRGTGALEAQGRADRTVHPRACGEQR